MPRDLTPASATPATRPLERLFKALPDPVLITDRDLRVTWSNEASARLLRLGRHQGQIGPRLTELLPGVVPEEALLSRLAGQERFEACLLCGLGARPVRLHLQVLLLPRDEGLEQDDEPALAFILRDLTEDAALLGRISRKERLAHFASVAGGLAHDFNNLLWTMAGSAELAMEEVPEDSPAREDLSLILKAAQLGKSLMGQVFSLSRADPARFSPIDLESLLKEVISLVRPTLPPTLEVRLKLGEGGMRVRGDKPQLTQLFINLFKNASQAVQARRGVVTLELATRSFGDIQAAGLGVLPGEYHEVVVGDNGRGMEPEVAERAFDPFFSRKPSGFGVGVGLTVARQVAGNHAGAITLESEAGKGSVVRVLLPALREGGSPRAERVLSHADQDQPVSVLLASGHKDQLGTMRRLLEAEGYRVTACASTGQALESFARAGRGMDIVVTDLEIDQTSGVFLAREIRRLSPGFPIVLLSANPALRDAGLAPELVSLVVSKPLAQGELLGSIREALAKT